METKYFPLYTDPVHSSHLTHSDFRINLTGAWLCDDGGAYFIRHHSFEPYVSKIDWLGLSERGLGNHFTNVFFGTMLSLYSPYKTSISGDWADVPRGRTTSSGILELQIEDYGRKLRAIRKSGGFGGSVWTRL
ncbi:hypothetical protein ACH2G3_25420 [Bacillus cereus]|uniref:hypothetical protein n=1 Tax=Bacillus cereus group sp. MYBK185-1 TaxID=3450672 RepID=UPI003799D10F